ncbi:MAG: helicase [Deltaproteobacteria bacterium HGW-Deltaproteobacteria-12]|jgi:superfamily II DNA or RNA helicase|nr:MAG: helicase [Deltaproteobacteria bacterium HGW-Deltaproteobacteria-12]
MTIQSGQIVKNLIPTEPVIVNKVQKLGNSFSISFTGVNTNRANTKVISSDEFQALEILTEEGTFNFKGDPVKFALFAEAERINSAYQFDPLFAVNCSIVDPLPHQVEAVYKFLLPLPKIRFLLADDTGAGKTIMTGLLIKELMMRGLVERVLIVTPGGLTKQWQEDELAVKFNIPFTLVNRSLFSSDPNVFHTAQRIITSIDFILREDVLNVASNSHWDLIVFDECHKLSAYDYGNKQYLSLRYKAAQVLSQQCEHILLLTATPHRGRVDTFKKLLQLLDEDIFATNEIASTRVKEIEHNGINKFFIRRLKEDMKDWQGKPLFKNRFTKTVAYQLTPEEKELYDAVTQYLTKRKEEASETKNIHVSLALTVMQRRLVSSIFAIKNTLERRWKALQGIVDEVNKNPNLWSQRHKLEGFDVDNIVEYEDLEDDERDALDNILSDPRKFKLFTTATSLQEIQQEANEVKKLFDMAQTLYNRKQEEKKFQELQELLKSNGVLEQGEKLVIFTEHKDTLLYLEERLTKSGGYKVVTIHGGKTVDERREAQWAFAKPDTQILIGTDAAGEGINLQFCRLLINWDIPWNPNRLEQRMGRIHRYGQKQDVLVFNMVASNTKEGKVLEKLLTKLDVIREGIGDDRVYDVIQDVLENIGMDDIIQAIFEGRENSYTKAIDEITEEKVKAKIMEQKQKLAHSTVDYKDARILKENSDEKRLQPIYIRLFFEKAFKQLGGNFTEIRPNIFRIDNMPEVITQELRNAYNIVADTLRQILFCFDKQVFLEYSMIGDLGKVHYINPGNPVFDSLINVVRNQYREDMLKGTVLISPDDKEQYFAFFVKSQIVDNRESKRNDSVADERLITVCQSATKTFHLTSPAKFIDLHAPAEFTKPIAPQEQVSNDEVVQWSFANITEKQFEDTKTHVQKDTSDRKKYLESAFTQVIMDLQSQIQELQGKVLLGDMKAQDKILKKQQRITELIRKKKDRLDNLELMVQLNPKAPEVLGCAFVVPLSQVEYKSHYGMSRDDEAEAIAMEVAVQYEISSGWKPTDVSANNEGFDIRSISPEEIKRYIEVKGRSADDGSVMLSENEMNRLAQLGNTAWLYIVMNCKSIPELHRIQNPTSALKFERKTKGVQYFLPMAEWKQKVATL